MTSEELRELQELAHQLDELTRHPGWAVLVDYAHFGDGMQQSHQRRVLGGGCRTPEEYQNEVGWIAGSQSILDIPDLVKKIRDRESAKGETAEPQ